MSIALVANDNRDYLQIYGRQVERAIPHVEVLKAETVEAAIALIRERVGTIDLGLIDYNFGLGMAPGTVIIQRWRELERQMEEIKRATIVLVTDSSNKRFLEDAMSVGADEALSMSPSNYEKSKQRLQEIITSFASKHD